MEFKNLAKRAAEIRTLYQELECSKYGRSWTDEEIALGFVGDVGDLGVESETGMAARLVVRRGLIFKNDVEIPLDWIDGWTPRGVGLNVAKSEMQALEDTRAA